MAQLRQVSDSAAVLADDPLFTVVSETLDRGAIDGDQVVEDRARAFVVAELFGVSRDLPVCAIAGLDT